jgi:hypothetical protein
MRFQTGNPVGPEERPSHHPGVARSNSGSWEAGPVPSQTSVWWKRAERGWWVALFGMMLVFSAFPIANQIWELSTKDYGLWYQVGLAVRQGLDIYPRPETGRLFPFMYPPSAAAMLGGLSLLGPTGTLIALVLANSVSWLVCIVLSVWLSVGSGMRRHPLVMIVPSLSVIVLIYNIYLLGQPNLLLLAMILGAFACLRLKRKIAAGVLVASAAAIKAFPILVLGYLIYRRMWTAAAATVGVLAAWLLIAPLPFRTPTQAVDDLVVWSKGMLFTYNTHGIAQRPLRSYSFKNQSIMAMAHRLLRDVPADGELVLSRQARAEHGGPSASKGPPLDPATDLLTFLKPHARSASAIRPAGIESRPRAGIGSDIGGTYGQTADRTRDGDAPPRWDDALQGAESALRSAWRVNLVDLDFSTVTAVTLVAMVGLCLFAAFAMPRQEHRTQATDALEFALVTLLTLIFSPLSFNYAYVWLLYPTTLAQHRVLSERATAPPLRHRLAVVWLVAVLVIPALAIPMPQLAQACGNLFIPAVLLVFGLGAMLRAEGRPRFDQTPLTPAHPVRDRRHAVAGTTCVRPELAAPTSMAAPRL